MAINNRGDSQQFNYTGGVQTFTVTRAGLYKFDVYGGKGGKGANKNGSGGAGGHSVGYTYLSVGDTIYIVCGGGNNTTYNGGGLDSGGSGAWAGKGGGATHIASVTGTLVSIGASNLDKIYIVAGGGGGGGETNTDGTNYKYGGAGGGSSGANATGGTYKGYGATQSQGGQGYSGVTTPEAETKGTFGQGGRATSNPPSGAYYGGGGGGGLYGGGGGSWSTDMNKCGGGGGGSGYIGGVPQVTFQGTTYSPSTSQGGNSSGHGYAIVTLEDVDYPYNITLSYDNTLGTASYEWNYARDAVELTATPNNDTQFLGWYVNSVQISDELTYTYTVLGDVTIEARFEPIYVVTASVNGNGAIQYSRGTDQNDITVSVIPDANHHFVKYTVNGTEYTTTPLQLHLTADVTIVAYFEDDDHYHISCPTNINNISVYISTNDVYSGTSVTLWARPFPDYNFISWGDGETTNPRTIVVTEDITLSANYQRITDTNGIYQYRCFVKDQLYLTQAPKSFMVVDTFDVNVDLLTNATSSIKVMELPTNINEGDVLVLYDPKGTFLYNGVITSIDDKTINCSQMQSFYHGSWVYQTSSKTYLEQEIATVLDLYAQGKQKGSSYTDPLVAQRLGGITVDYTGSITSHLPTRYSGSGSQYEVVDMEEFIYELYQRYGIIFDFEINFSGTNYVHIKVPTYTKIAVGNNMYAIKDMSPVTEIEETNRLIVYATNNTYRKTYVATKTGIVEEPSTTANRFNITNTEIVFSDDTLADLVSANLPNTMYNHKVTFTLVIKNFIYQFGDFNLGGELDVYHNDDFYNTVLTGYRITKESNQNITEAEFTCGKVRYALTKMLTMGVV